MVRPTAASPPTGFASSAVASRRVFLASHTIVMSGPMDYFEDYLLRRGYEVVRLDHPLDTYSGRHTVLSRNRSEIARWERRGRGPFNLLWDFLQTVRTAWSVTWDVGAGANNFDTLCLLTARRLRRGQQRPVIYLAADFSEERFANPVMDWIYMRVEREVLRKADLVVSNTRRAEARRIDLGVSPQRSMVIPNGVLLRAPTFPQKKIRKDRFVFVGSVTREHGLFDLVSVLKPVIQSLTIIGHGDDWDRVVELCRRENIPHELFHNRPHDFVIDYLHDFDGIGLAPYNMESKWTYYCSPLKVNEYVACGLPVMTSSVPEIATTIRERNLGIVYDRLDFSHIRDLLEAFDPTDFHHKAESFYADFNSDSLYERICT